MVTRRTGTHGLALVTDEPAERPGADDWHADFSYAAERDQALDHNRCFLCGADLTEVERTDEHVFPQWMLGDFALHNERLTLPNQTTIPYRQLKIPCCDECNNVWLSQLEDDVATAVRTGADAVAALDPSRLVVWMAKIFYGLLFKDLSLAADRLHPTGDKLVDEHLLKRFAALHRVLQTARQRVRLALGQTPGSVFVFRTLESAEPKLRFDYRDLLASPFLALRLGGVGLVGCLVDWGAVAMIESPKLDIARQLELHPVQFCEVAAFCAHWQMRFNRTPKYVIVGGKGDEADELITLPLAGMSGLPLIDDFDPELYANLLSAFTGFPLERVWYQDSGQLWTSLEQDGKPLQLPGIDDYRFEPPGGS